MGGCLRNAHARASSSENEPEWSGQDTLWRNMPEVELLPSLRPKEERPTPCSDLGDPPIFKHTSV